MDPRPAATAASNCPRSAAAGWVNGRPLSAYHAFGVELGPLLESLTTWKTPIFFGESGPDNSKRMVGAGGASALPLRRAVNPRPTLTAMRE